MCAIVIENTYAKNQANMPNTLTSSSAVFHMSGGYGVEPGGGSSSSSKPKVQRLPRKLGSFPRGFCMACHMIKRPGFKHVQCIPDTMLDIRGNSWFRDLKSCF